MIDAHYGEIAAVGMAKNPSTVRIDEGSRSRFRNSYGLDYDEVLATGEVHTAITALDALNVTPRELLDRCLVADYVKMKSGLYCAKLDKPEGKPLYVLNGFYARMRDKFVSPGARVAWQVVRFDAKGLPWRTFRHEVIGATNPFDAVAGSLRSEVLQHWQELGLPEPPNYQDNAVHASAGPLESLRERQIWVKENPLIDPLATALLARGLSEAQVQALTENPEIQLGAGGPASRAFALLEDVDTLAAVDMLASAEFVET
eukprot:TRINITY_DN29328_c0_g1_i1.p1 TRINITY_DN29328_c0_g1~~TRINITY_DN29328_c0_g1_i1.p1  ORF type:complete len:287 (+),score=46.31 TRINITY_DN29328_c0_g1_i1:87-863(+)